MKETMTIYTVQWIDARVSVDRTNPTLPLMTSIGVITHRDKEKIIVCSLFGEDNDSRIIVAILDFSIPK